MEKKHRISLLIIVFLHLLMSVLIWGSDYEMPPLLFYYMSYFPVATALVGLIDTVIALMQKHIGCGMLSVISGLLSILSLVFFIWKYHFKHRSWFQDKQILECNTF